MNSENPQPESATRPDSHPPEPGAKAPATASSKLRSGLEPATAALTGWALQAVLALAMARAVPTLQQRGFGMRLLHLAYVASHLLLLGAVSFWIVAGWRRWGPRRALWRVVAVGAASYAVALCTTYNDFAGWMARHELEPALVFPALAFVPAAAVTVAMLALVWSSARRWLRWVMLAAAAALSAANHTVLVRDYEGMHLFWAWIAALLTTGFLLASGRGSLLAGRARIAAATACSVVGLLSVTVAPPLSLRPQLLLTSGAVATPFVARFWSVDLSSEPPLPIEQSPWFSDRSNAPPRPPGPALELPEDKIVIFITIEALRADVVADEYYRRNVPELHRLKRQSVYFTLARACAPATAVSVLGFLIGKYYSSTHWTRQGADVTPIAEKSPRLPALLERAGVRTTTVTPLVGKDRLVVTGTGLQRGFGQELHTARKFGPASEMLGLLLDALERRPDGAQFYYLHFIDSHGPFKPTREDETAFDVYLARLRYIDRHIRHLRRFLRAQGLDRRTVLIVAGDHGEAFNEHGYDYHALCVYEEVLRIPLMIGGPGIRHRVVDVPVTLIDMMPTLLDLFGQPTPGYVMGESLAPFLRGDTPELTRPIAVDTGRRMQVLYFDDGYKVMTDLDRATVEVYDLSTDPDEMEDLTDKDPKAKRYIATQKAFFDAHTLKIPGWKPPWRKF